MEHEFEENPTFQPLLPRNENPFEPFLGALPAFTSLEEINAWVREMRGDDEEAEEPSI